MLKFILHVLLAITSCTNKYDSSQSTEYIDNLMRNHPIKDLKYWNNYNKLLISERVFIAPNN